jgi:hypothetical protein
MENPNQEAQEQTETQFLKQFNRIKEGIRLAKYVEWDDDEGCFIINRHKLFFERHEGWHCDCEDRIYPPNWWCKHMIGLIYYMGGLPQAQEMVDKW